MQCENVKLNKRRDLLTETYDKLTKDILLSEHKWDFLLRIQVIGSWFIKTDFQKCSEFCKIEFYRITITY